jgi:drug/metabolite transporter (DMT)-like permease
VFIMSPVVKSESSLLAIGAAFAGIYLIWGTTYLGIAIAIQTIPPFISGAVRFLIAAALMYAWVRVRCARPFDGINRASATAS